MAYPYNYYPSYQQYTPQNQQTDERIWVQGKPAADAFLVAPNSFVRLWDSTSQTFYEKRADPSGRPYMESFKYERMEPVQASQSSEGINEYTKRLKAIEGRIEALERSLHESAESDADDTAV